MLFAGARAAAGCAHFENRVSVLSAGAVAGAGVSWLSRQAVSRCWCPCCELAVRTFEMGNGGAVR